MNTVYIVGEAEIGTEEIVATIRVMDSEEAAEAVRLEWVDHLKRHNLSDKYQAVVQEWAIL